MFRRRSQEDKKFFFSFYIVDIYTTFTRKQIASLSFGRDFCTHLGVVFSEVCGPSVFHTKGGGLPLSALPKDTTGNLAGLFSTTFLKCRAPSREAENTIF